MMNLSTFDFSALGVVLASFTGVGSFFLGRHLRRRRQEKKQARERAALEATQSRQVRRARERGQRK
jgi:membrane protein YqaA with SNARE-associated domain